MISSSLFINGIHPLLDNRPFAIIGNNKAMQVKVKSILDRPANHEGTWP
jgi:hypothetical protein